MTQQGQIVGKLQYMSPQQLNGKEIKSANSIVWMRSDGAGETIRLLESPNLPRPWSVSPDGRQLAYLEQTPETGLEADKLFLTFRQTMHATRPVRAAPPARG